MNILIPPSRESAQLLADAQNKDNSAMQRPLLAPEIHARALQEKRMQRLLQMEQYRAAGLSLQHPFRRMIRAVRNVIGSSLVSVGHRMQGDGDAPTRVAGIS